MLKRMACIPLLLLLGCRDNQTVAPPSKETSAAHPANTMPDQLPRRNATEVQKVHPAASTNPMPNDDQLLENREIVLRGVIDDKTAKVVVAKMLYLQHLDRRAPFTLHIDSLGGSVTSALGILDAIDKITPPVRTCCHRHAEAMAAIIAAHGAKGQRFAESESTLSLSAAYGVENAMGQPGEVEKVNRILAEFVAKDTGRTLGEAGQSIKSGIHFSAIQAKEFRLIDAIRRCPIVLPE
jgi:ATP-dependent Clp protease protease subunit